MSYAAPPDGDADPRPIMAQLIATCPELELIRAAEPDIAIYMRTAPKISGGKSVIGTMSLPAWQGPLASLALYLLAMDHGDVPDFILTLDGEWWETATARQREALVFHELLHCDQATDKDGERRFSREGLPVWAIREHDITAFNAEVARYGAWTTDIQAFLGAARENRLNDG